MSTTAVSRTSHVVYELARPFPTAYVESVQGNAYVAHHIVLQRLIHIFGVPPKLEIVKEIYDDRGLVLTGVLMRMTVPGLEPVEEFGEADNPMAKTNGARAKSAASDALKRCFVAGTQVWTARGHIPIEQVLVGDLVMTRGGWRRVISAGPTGVHPTVEVVTNGARLRCTEDHPFLTTRGFLPAGELKRGAMLFSWRDLPERLANQWSMTASPFAVMKGGRTSQDGTRKLGTQRPYTAVSMRRRSVLSLTGGTSTMRTGTDATTPPAILLHWTRGRIRRPMLMTTEARIALAASAAGCITQASVAGAGVPLAGAHRPAAIRSEGHAESMRSRGSASSARGPSWRPTSAIAAERVDAPALSNSRIEVSSHARSAGPHSWPDDPGLDSAPVVVSSVLPRAGAAVWNLEIEQTPEFFAEGLLVHNCAMRLGLGLHLWAQEHYFLYDALAKQNGQEDPQHGVAAD